MCPIRHWYRLSASPTRPPRRPKLRLLYGPNKDLIACIAGVVSVVEVHVLVDPGAGIMLDAVVAVPVVVTAVTDVNKLAASRNSSAALSCWLILTCHGICK